MTSREQILNRVKKHLPKATDYPDTPIFPESTDLITDFKNHLITSGGACVEAREEAMDQVIKDLFPEVRNVLKFPEKTKQPDFPLENLEVAILKAEFGVAENGAVWIPEGSMGLREIPVITEHLVVVLDKKKMVSNMHEAYSQITSLPDYGVFICGPSKTADIEQSLVIGAHGPKSHTVILI